MHTIRKVLTPVLTRQRFAKGSCVNRPTSSEAFTPVIGYFQSISSDSMFFTF